MTSKDILTQLVGIKSPSKQEGELIEFVQNFVRTHTSHQGERLGNNLIVFVQGHKKDACLIFNGHTDTVSAGDHAMWTSNPFVLREEDTRLYGLGTSDMKGALAVYLNLLVAWEETPPPSDIIVMFVAEEETSGQGTKDVLAYLQRKQLLQRYMYLAAIIGESSGLAVELGHRGNAFVEVDFQGEGGHGSQPPSAQESAIYKASCFITSVQDKNNGWEKYSDDVLGAPSIAVTKMVAGLETSANQIPADCQVQLDIRTTPVLHQKVVNEVNAWAAQYHGNAHLTTSSPVGYCDPNATIAKTAMHIGHQTEVQIAQGSTDQCFFTQFGIPAIICGPGTRQKIHAPNEYVESAMLGKAERIYQEILKEWVQNVKLGTSYR